MFLIEEAFLKGFFFMIILALAFQNIFNYFYKHTIVKKFIFVI